ncbi:MAG: DUF4395 domain-containing protein [Dehalococcoidia bacterium]
MTVRELFSFPHPVNEVSARFVAAGVVLMTTATIAFDEPWFIALIAYGFLARVLTGPKLSPLGLFVTRVLVPALGNPSKMVAGPPKRFAQGMGFIITATAGVLALGFGQVGAAYVLLGMVAAAATLEAVFAFCLGCRIFALLMRAKIIPERVCQDCADVWARDRNTATQG